MSRERIARVALQSFPAPVRVAHGEEMLDTLLDVSGTSRTRFMLELIGFVRSGMQTRAIQAAQAGAWRVVADGFCLAAVWLLTLFLASDLADRNDPAWRELTASRRELMLVPAICFSVLLIAPRRRRPDARRLAWLALTATLAVATSTSDDPTAAILLLALLFLVPPALAMLQTDPRLAIACAVPATSFGIHMAQDRGGPGFLGVLFLSAAPLILTVAATRTRDLQAQTRI